MMGQTFLSATLYQWLGLVSGLQITFLPDNKLEVWAVPTDCLCTAGGELSSHTPTQWPTNIFHSASHMF